MEWFACDLPGQVGFETKSRRALGIQLDLICVRLRLRGARTALAQDATPARCRPYIQLADGEKLADKQEITIGVNRNLVNGQGGFLVRPRQPASLGAVD